MNPRVGASPRGVTPQDRWYRYNLDSVRHVIYLSLEITNELLLLEILEDNYLVAIVATGGAVQLTAEHQ